MEFWSLPGPRHFVGRVADAVRAGRSIIVRVPDYPALEFEHALRHELDGWYWHALPLTADRLPLDALYQRFLPSVLPDQVRNAYALAQADSMRGTVIQLEGMTAAVWAVWRDFLLEYQNACRMIPETTRGVFVAIVPARIAAEAVVEEIAIATLDFRACVGELDLLPYVGYRLQHRNVVGPRRMLLATALARVALWDAETADRLLEAGPDAIMDPLETLRQIALERGWERLDTPSWISGSEDEVDGVPRVHSAYAAVHDERGLVNQRLWSAQAAVLLPLIEERRRALIPQVRQWLKLPFDTGYERITDPWDLEIGQIAYQVRARGSARIRREVDELRRLRNQLSHLEVVPMDSAFMTRLLR
jgi:hypothetical protein